MNYWQNRYENLKKNMEKDEDKLKKKLSFFYDKERVSLEKEIASFYQRYGENNIIEYRNLLQSLSMEEKDMLIKRADEFIEKYPKYKNILPVRENIYKLNRLEGLKYSILLKQYEIGAIEQEEIENHLRKYALKGANITYETLGFGKNFLSINSDVISKILDNSYAGEDNFSDRIWNNKKKLANYLNNDFAKAAARGDSYDKCVKFLKERFSKVTRNDCYRLIFTEGTYVLNESAITPFEEDFESYEISTVGDGRVCSICRGIKGKVFNIKERTPGINFPPFHPWCRCSFEVVVDDWDKWLEEYESKHGKNQGKNIINNIQKDKKDGKIKEKNILEKPIKSDDEYYGPLISKLQELNVEYIPVKEQSVYLTNEDIIKELAGGDLTSGSCASLGFAYIGQRQGYDILDFRGGESQEFFSQSLNLYAISKAKGIKTLRASGKSSLTVGNRLLKQCEVGKEYYLCTGQHAAIVRKTENNTLQYLELQSQFSSGWIDFEKNPRRTLYNRFGCRQNIKGKIDFMIDISDSDFSTDEFRSLIGFINTKKDKQRKGKYGDIK